MKKGGLKFVFSKKIHKMLKNPLFCDFLEKPSLDFAETYLFLILEVCSLKRNHFHLVNIFLGSQPIMNDVHTWLRYIANGIRIISDMHAVVSTVHALRIQMCSCL